MAKGETGKKASATVIITLFADVNFEIVKKAGNNDHECPLYSNVVSTLHMYPHGRRKILEASKYPESNNLNVWLTKRKCNFISAKTIIAQKNSFY